MIKSAFQKINSSKKSIENIVARKLEKTIKTVPETMRID